MCPRTMSIISTNASVINEADPTDHLDDVNRCRMPRLSTVFWTALTAGVLVFLGIHEWTARKQQAAQEAAAELRLQDTQRAIDALVASTGAVADWKAIICSPENKSSVLTAELQQVLLRDDNRPLLVTGNLEDMSDDNGQHVIEMSSDLCRNATLSVQATADSEQAKTVLSHRSERVAYLAMAVRVTSVQKQQANSAKAGTDGSDEGDNLEDVFVVRGQSMQIISTGWEGFRLDIHNQMNMQRQAPRTN